MLRFGQQQSWLRDAISERGALRPRRPSLSLGGSSSGWLDLLFSFLQPKHQRPYSFSFRTIPPGGAFDFLAPGGGPPVGSPAAGGPAVAGPAVVGSPAVPPFVLSLGMARLWLCPHCALTGLRLLLVCRPFGRTGHYRRVALAVFAVRCCDGRRCGCVVDSPALALYWTTPGRPSWVAGQLTDPPRRRGGTLMPDHTAARRGASAARARQRRLEVVEVVVHHFELATRLVV
jgi:hypothetical protein